MSKIDIFQLVSISAAAIGISYLAIKLISELTSTSSSAGPKAHHRAAKSSLADGDQLTEMSDEEKIQANKFTKRTLSQYTGATDPNGPVLIAVKGIVYDVSVNGGRDFYGPGGPYSIFSGRDASRLFSMFEFDNGMTEEELDSPIDKLDDLTFDQQESLEAYIQLFESKYMPVGVLVESL
ncbi:Damage response protein 1 [Smittium culicis]|uniref:Damage response protein 1 n=2 Tax=Smittium culicis TaxID=133412 RepID=A0A1R1XXA5_9FUNG|nr:Damage response protein 1 [Smittium culicis]